MRSSTRSDGAREIVGALLGVIDGAAYPRDYAGRYYIRLIRIAFFDHMLTLFAKHAVVDLSVICKGDLEVDAHHTVEDCGIALGEAFVMALGDKKGIRRYGAGFHP